MISKLIRYILIGLGIVIFALLLTVFFQYKKLQSARLFLAVDAKVQTELNKLGLLVTEKKIEQQGFPIPQQMAKIEVEIPLRLSLDKLLEQIKQGFSSSKVQILKFKEENLKNTYNIHLELGQDKSLTHRLLFSLKKAKVALLIDDFGYINKDKLLNAFFEDLSVPLTIAIIPGTQFAKEIAEKAHQNNIQILVHLPMQPKGDFKNQYKWIILDGMSREKIENITKEAIEFIPHAQGLNNHMGSLVTTKKELMEPVLQVLKKKQMFFVDSKTSPLSIAYPLAKNLGIKSTYNCVFLDNEKQIEYIENQFNKLILQAIENKWALGLGHLNEITALTLHKLTTNCDNRKIEFVLISEILN